MRVIEIMLIAHKLFPLLLPARAKNQPEKPAPTLGFDDAVRATPTKHKPRLPMGWFFRIACFVANFKAPLQFPTRRTPARRRSIYNFNKHDYLHLENFYLNLELRTMLTLIPVVSVVVPVTIRVVVTGPV